MILWYNTKGILRVYKWKVIYSAFLSAYENFFLKNPTSGKRLIFNVSRLLYVSTLPLTTPIFGIKYLPCRRFLQHYYRDTFIESHRKPTDVLEMSLFCSMLALIPQSGDFSGATLGVRSVALLQVPKLLDPFDTKTLLCRRFLQYIIRKCCKIQQTLA